MGNKRTQYSIEFKAKIALATSQNLANVINAAIILIYSTALHVGVSMG